MCENVENVYKSEEADRTEKLSLLLAEWINEQERDKANL